MHIPTLIKYLVLAWCVPILIVFIIRFFTPDPSQTRADFAYQVFRPARVWVDEERGSKNSDHFELWIRNPTGEEFFHRDPEREPILDLYSRLPKDSEIKILFSPSAEGNVLMEVTPTNPPSASVLAFQTVMDAYASRRRVVYIVAAVWCGIANLFSFALWKVDIAVPEVNQTSKHNQPPQPTAGKGLR